MNILIKYFSLLLKVHRMIFYKYVFNIFFLFILLTTAINKFFAIHAVDTTIEKKEKKQAAAHKNIKFKKIVCSKKTKKTTADDEDHADDECHEEEENEKEAEEEREEAEREEKEREERDEEENDDEDEKEKTLDDIKTVLLSLCMTEEERQVVENLNHDQAKSLLKILQKA
jgi:hypothetical protein